MSQVNQLHFYESKIIVKNKKQKQKFYEEFYCGKKSKELKRRNTNKHIHFRTYRMIDIVCVISKSVDRKTITKNLHEHQLLHFISI